jgi:cyclophilin family peptidyl-prolyl cis-trans isomerase
VPRAEKRQRKKDNARAARAEREAAVKRRKRIRTAITVAAVVAGFVVLVLIVSLISGDDDNNNEVAADATTTTTQSDTSTSTSTPVAAANCTPDPGSKNTATITTNFGEIVIAMDDARAPKGSARFVELSKDKFYDGLTWHRASKDFVIQGGDPTGDGSGGSGSSIVAEVPTDNYPVGSLAAAKKGTDPAGTFDSQFFIVTGANGGTLPNDYARFGCVTSGIENAQKIEALAPAQGDGPPTQKATIDKIVITEK